MAPAPGSDSDNDGERFYKRQEANYDDVTKTLVIEQSRAEYLHQVIVDNYPECQQLYIRQCPEISVFSLLQTLEQAQQIHSIDIGEGCSKLILVQPLLDAAVWVYSQLASNDKLRGTKLRAKLPTLRDVRDILLSHAENSATAPTVDVRDTPYYPRGDLLGQVATAYKVTVRCRRDHVAKLSSSSGGAATSPAATVSRQNAAEIDLLICFSEQSMPGYGLYRRIDMDFTAESPQHLPILVRSLGPWRVTISRHPTGTLRQYLAKLETEECEESFNVGKESAVGLSRSAYALIHDRMIGMLRKKWDVWINILRITAQLHTKEMFCHENLSLDSIVYFDATPASGSVAATKRKFSDVRVSFSLGGMEYSFDTRDPRLRVYGGGVYASPDYFTDCAAIQGDLTKRDVYALACLFLDMMTGNKCFLPVSWLPKAIGDVLAQMLQPENRNRTTSDQARRDSILIPLLTTAMDAKSLSRPAFGIVRTRWCKDAFDALLDGEATGVSIPASILHRCASGRLEFAAVLALAPASLAMWRPPHVALTIATALMAMVRQLEDGSCDGLLPNDIEVNGCIVPHRHAAIRTASVTVIGLLDRVRKDIEEATTHAPFEVPLARVLMQRAPILKARERVLRVEAATAVSAFASSRMRPTPVMALQNTSSIITWSKDRNATQDAYVSAVGAIAFALFAQLEIIAERAVVRGLEVFVPSRAELESAIARWLADRYEFTSMDPNRGGYTNKFRFGPGNAPAGVLDLAKVVAEEFNMQLSTQLASSASLFVGYGDLLALTMGNNSPRLVAAFGQIVNRELSNASEVAIYDPLGVTMTAKVPSDASIITLRFREVDQRIVDMGATRPLPADPASYPPGAEHDPQWCCHAIHWQTVLHDVVLRLAPYGLPQSGGGGLIRVPGTRRFLPGPTQCPDDGFFAALKHAIAVSCRPSFASAAAPSSVTFLNTDVLAMSPLEPNSGMFDTMRPKTCSPWSSLKFSICALLRHASVVATVVPWCCLSDFLDFRSNVIFYVHLPVSFETALDVARRPCSHLPVAEARDDASRQQAVPYPAVLEAVRTRKRERPEAARVCESRIYRILDVANDGDAMLVTLLDMQNTAGSTSRLLFNQCPPDHANVMGPQEHTFFRQRTLTPFDALFSPFHEDVVENAPDDVGFLLLGAATIPLDDDGDDG